jgi:hypothetical protein
MNSYVRDFLREADRLGVVGRVLVQGRKTIKFTGAIAGKRIVYRLAITPSDSRCALRNATADLRRLVRAAVGPTHQPKPKGRPKSQSYVRPLASPTVPRSAPSITPVPSAIKREMSRIDRMQAFCTAYGATPSGAFDPNNPWAALAPLLKRLQASQPEGEKR